MELKPGYKQTEVGVIPEDWDVKALGQIGEALIGLTYKPGDVRIDGILVLRSSNIQEDSLRFENNVFVEKEIPDRIMVRPGDILICVRNGSRDLIGKTALLDERTIGMTFGAFMAVFRSSKGHFINYTFQSHVIKKQINEHLGATINQITNKSLNSFLIALPPTEVEQRSIATALSDMDELLGGLDRLITKKRDLKQSAMQQLLTGKTRLPGFGEGKGYKQTEIGVISEDWKIQTLLEVCIKIQDGTHFSPSISGNEYLYVTSKNIGFGILKLDNIDRIDELQHRKIYNRCDVKKGDILLTKDGVNTGNAALNTLDEEFSLLSSVAFLRFDQDKYDASYFLQQILSSDGQQRMKDLMSGNAITRLTLQKIHKISFPVPPLPEQIAIASILSDMDTEITTLEQRRNKTRDLKQAMMQELLTGRIRLL
jgi:type I restriction enzyme, S subunit